ncbi:MAG: DMT family transporter [Pyrobaculum sp.]
MYGIAAALVATLAFSINAPLVRAATLRGVSPTALVTIRNITALAILLPFTNYKFDLEVAAIAAASAILGPGLGDYAYFKAIKQSGVATAVTIGYTYIFTTQIFTSAIGLESPTTYTLIGAALAFGGISIALGGRINKGGVLYGAVASISWGAASALLGLVSKEASPYTIAVIRSAALIPLFLPFTNFRVFTTSGVLYATASGVVGLAIGSIAFIQSMALVGVAATVVATSLTPILSQILDRAINKESISPKHILGAMLVSLGVVITVMNN